MGPEKPKHELTTVGWVYLSLVAGGVAAGCKLENGFQAAFDASLGSLLTAIGLLAFVVITRVCRWCETHRGWLPRVRVEVHHEHAEDLRRVLRKWRHFAAHSLGVAGVVGLLVAAAVYPLWGDHVAVEAGLVSAAHVAFHSVALLALHTWRRRRRARKEE